MQAALGKSGAALIPMLKDGAAAMREMMDIAPNVIPERAIAVSVIFNDNITHIKEVVQSFFNTVKGGILEAITPYVLMLRDWIDEHRELIKVKIQEFLRGVVSLIGKIRPQIPVIIEKVRGFIGFVKPFVTWMIDKLPELIPVIIGVVGAFLTFSTVVKVIDTVKGAITGLQAVLAMGPLGIAPLVISALIGGFIILVQKVGGVDEALNVIGETLRNLKDYWLNSFLHPVQTGLDNLFETLVWTWELINKIPGANKLTGDSNPQARIDQIRGWQEKYTPDTKSFAGAFSESYLERRQKYLEERAAKDADDKAEWDRIVERLNKLIEGQKVNTAAVEGLGDNSERARGLTYSQMGQSDIWDIIEAGAH
jgi:hypothetical protein